MAAAYVRSLGGGAAHLLGSLCPSEWVSACSAYMNIIIDLLHVICNWHEVHMYCTYIWVILSQSSNCNVRKP